MVELYVGSLWTLVSGNKSRERPRGDTLCAPNVSLNAKLISGKSSSRKMFRWMQGWAEFIVFKIRISNKHLIRD